jgi:hypothetical protein
MAQFDDIRPANRALELQEDTAARETLTIDERRKRFWNQGPLPNGRGAKTVLELSAPPAIMTGETSVTGQISSDQAPDVNASSVALNGAQVQAATEIVSQVSAGTLPRDSALAMLQNLFGLTLDQANNILGSAGQIMPAKAWPSPAQADLRRWRDKALKAFKAEGSGLVKFESDAIDPDLAEQIRHGLEHAADAESVKAVFAAALEVAGHAPFFRGGSGHRFEGYAPALAAPVEPVRAAA